VGSLLEVGTGFHPELSGRENIYLNGAILGMRRQEIDRKFDEIVDFAEIEQFLDTPVKRYSSGMHVRLAFAVAAHLEPEILLVDEVLAVGDVAFQKKCLGKMGDVAMGGRTVLFVSHNMAAIEALCKNALLLSHGKVVALGTTSEMVRIYLKRSDIASEIKNGILKGIFTQNLAGITTSAFRINEPIRIKIQLALGSNKIVNPVIGIGVNSVLGQRLFTVGTYFQQDTIPPIIGNVEIVCEITDPVLTPGEFSIKLAISDNVYSTLLDVEDILRFEVIASDYFGNGQIPNSRQGVVVAKSTWKIQHLDE
jgi:lipopolysaccharide transport system ATP-binding protein